MATTLNRLSPGRSASTLTTYRPAGGLETGNRQEYGGMAGKPCPGDSYFADDGFLQKPKVLFIARETRYIAGQDNIAVILKKCRENATRIGGESLLRRMLLIAYGVRHGGMVPFEIVDPVEICALAGTDNGFSFAFMEISKYSKPVMSIIRSR
jgi:hypothetical protein